MFKSFIKCFIFVCFVLLHTKTSYADNRYAIAKENVAFRSEPSFKSDIIKLVITDSKVEVVEESDEWSKVKIGDNLGYIKTAYIDIEETNTFNGKTVELLPWSSAKQVFTIGVDVSVYDIYSGKTYKVRSFSNGLHADVEPITKEDTAIMKQTFGGVWQWDPRPVIVTINNRSIAASINGMPHGGGVNSANGMNGQVCIHFKGSAAHNGNSSFTRLHQAVLMDAYYAFQ